MSIHHPVAHLYIVVPACAGTTTSGIDESLGRDAALGQERLERHLRPGARGDQVAGRHRLPMRALGVDQKATAPLEPFATDGVPSVAALARELDALTPALQQASEPEPGDATFLGRLKANAEKLVRITPAGAPAGNDPAAVVARIRFDAAHGDIAAALATIDTLPDSAKSLAAALSKKAAAREAALAASRQIAADALAALATPAAR